MRSPVRVVFWTTTFQADILALARFMCQDHRFDPVVVLEQRDNFLKEPVQQVLPVTCPLLDRDAKDTIKQVKEFNPDVTIVDNHFPPKKLSPKLFVLWHGLGWKGPNDVKEFAQVHKSIRKLTGMSSMESNPHFRWQCFGPTDLEHRHRVSGFARENLISLGSAFTDELKETKITREQAKDYYSQLPREKKTVLIALTWHYGKVFSHWGEDLDIFKKVLDHISRRNCSAIIRLHDRKRFDQDYLKRLEALVAQQNDTIIKFKDHDRDSLLDIVVSDMMISNFSSILNYYYATGKPSIHVYPVNSSNETFLWRVWRKGKVSIKEVPSAHYIWKLPPEENGGLLVRSLQQLIGTIDQALASPDCCNILSNAYIDKHMAPVDGNTCQRICDAVLAFSSLTHLSR